MANRGTAANGPSTNTDGDELDFELVTSARQLGAAPALRKEAVSVEGWLTASGKTVRLTVFELTALEYGEFIEEGRTYNKDGTVDYDSKGEDVRFLAWCVRDPNNNRLWPKTADAVPVLGSLGRTTLNVLMAAANRVNKSREASNGGNSDTAPSDS